MRRAVALVPAALLLAGCGSTPATGDPGSLPGTGGALALTAESARCAQSTPTPEPGASASPVPGTQCSVRVYYANRSSAPLAIDASLTRLVDSTGTTYRGEPAPGASPDVVVTPGNQMSVDWIVTLPVGGRLASVTWIGPSGDSASTALGTASAPATPTPTPTPTPKPTPKPTVKPTPKPAPAPTRTRTSKPRPASSAPPASGTIG